MRLIIASDIHGAARHCEQLMRVIEDERPDRVILLGDLLYHGPRNDLPDDYAPKSVIEMLNGIADRIIAVRGNCEAEVDQMVLDFPCMDDFATIDDIDVWDESGRLSTIFITHGHVWGPGLHNSIDHMPQLRRGDVLLYGHTHVKVHEERDGVTIFNPGSVGIPKDGSHSCGLYEDGRLTHLTL